MARSELIPEDMLLVLDYTANRWVDKLVDEYKKISRRSLRIRYLGMDVDDDSIIHISAYSVPKTIAKLAPEALEVFQFALRYDEESHSILPVESITDWCRRIAINLHKLNQYWNSFSLSDVLKMPKADCLAYLLHKMCTDPFPDEVCAALIKAVDLQEDED